MKTKLWIALLAAVLVLCISLSAWLLMPGEEAVCVKVYSEGKLLYTLPLNVDTQMEIVSGYGSNLVTVNGGKVAVTQADCPDGYCMDRGYCSGGAQIVCLPNRLVLVFSGKQTVDGVSG